MKKQNRSAHILLSILGSVGIVALPVSVRDFAHPVHSMLSVAQADAPQPSPGGDLLFTNIGGSCCGAGAAGNGCDGCDGCSSGGDK